MNNVTVKTVLRKLEPYVGFVYQQVRLEDEVLIVEIVERKGSRGHCARCGEAAPGYDREKARFWRYVPLWGLVVFLRYAPRRLNCARCGVHVEKLPWATGKLRIANTFRVFLAQWARLLSWREVADRFAVGWNSVYNSVSWVVAYGLEHRVLGPIEAIGVDEIHVKRRGKVFWTVVYQIDSQARRLLWIGEDRTKATFGQFFDEMGPEVCASIRFVCSDMWKAYLSVVKARLGDQAVHVIDRFHVVKRLLEALDEMRRKERTAMANAGAPPLLKNMRWAFLKRRSRWTSKERVAMAELERAGLAVCDARLLVEGFDRFWSYRSVGWARKFLTAWIATVRRKRRPQFAPLKRAASTLEKHSDYLLNFIRSKGLNSGVVEGLNRRLKMTSNRSAGFRTDKARKVALYHELGKLPLPPLTHSFF